jgi:cell division protein FtsB
MDNANTGRIAPVTDQQKSPSSHVEAAAAHEKAIAALNAERSQLTKQLEALRSERQVLEAVARKVANTRRSSGGAHQQA